LNFKQAVTEMSDYLVQIRKKPGVWGELTTVTKNQPIKLITIHKWIAGGIPIQLLKL